MDSKIIRKRPEKKDARRINSADVFVILLCIVCIIGMVLRFGVLETIENNAKSQGATMTVLIEGISSSSKDYLTAGDIVYMAEDGNKIGSLSSVLSVTPSVFYEYSDDGSINEKQSVNGRVDIRAVITIEGSMTEAGFLLDGTTYVAPNMRLSICTSSFSVTALITDITVVEK